MGFLSWTSGYKQCWRCLGKIRGNSTMEIIRCNHVASGAFRGAHVPKKIRKVYYQDFPWIRFRKTNLKICAYWEWLWEGILENNQCGETIGISPTFGNSARSETLPRDERHLALFRRRLDFPLLHFDKWSEEVTLSLFVHCEGLQNSVYACVFQNCLFPEAKWRGLCILFDCQEVGAWDTRNWLVECECASALSLWLLPPAASTSQKSKEDRRFGLHICTCIVHHIMCSLSWTTRWWKCSRDG